MKWQSEISNLLITADGKLIVHSETIQEILGVTETNGRLNFKLLN